ncbi:Rv3654c family TadE-like protein [Microbacterium sp. NPDC089695]|uniref:Rv3654c family TadE-like protein n=1 Tax=Microbacterium sp. NPDC089695 TaxID=3364198 RepID=UPI003803EA0C
MAGTALAAGVLTVSAALALGLAAVGGAAVTAQRAAGAADAAALAAADASSGAVPTAETPCGLAARVAAASGARLVECDVADAVATVRVQAAYAGLAAVSRARAGPPEER